MKKIKLSVAALLIALNTNAQDASYYCSNTQDTLYYCNLDSKVTMTNFEVLEMINTIEDILEWQEYDRENGETGMGSYEEKWGSAYWLRIMRDELYNKLNTNEVR